MGHITQPLLAGKVTNFEKIQYPVLATPKIDGIRALKIDGHLVSRNFKPIPNNHIRTTLEGILMDGMDGEVISDNAQNFGEVTSAVMSFDGTPSFKYCLFDYVDSRGTEVPYSERMMVAGEWYRKQEAHVREMIVLLYPIPVHNYDYLATLEAKYLSEGYEGVMIRKPDGKYKCGRSTEKEAILLKIKRFADSEAEIIGFEEKESNQNEKEKDAFGNTVRSSKKEGKVAAGTLGAIVVRDIKSGVEFKIGSGFNDSLRQCIWDTRPDYLGKIVKYKHQDIGGKEAPRFPIFLGVRSTNDM